MQECPLGIKMNQSNTSQKLSTTDDLRIVKMKELLAPQELIEEIPLSAEATATVVGGRTEIQSVLAGRDDRLVAVVGPCSIHDPDSARTYAERLAKQRAKHAADLLIVMRVYFEKPRTTVGWKGLINDPGIDDSFQINRGLRLARGLLNEINLMGLPTGTEFLDLISPQYVADLVSWGAIGARTTESQGHRELASGLSCPVGFKNGTSGNVQIAVDAIRAATYPHHFLSVTKAGHSAIFATAGNPDCHLILRGGIHINYDAASVDAAAKLLEAAELEPRVMVDCSHANSRKLHYRQAYVCRDLCTQVAAGDKRIFGLMIESNLFEGNQKPDAAPRKPGVSITDSCIGWEETESLLDDLAESVRQRRRNLTTTTAS